MRPRRATCKPGTCSTNSSSSAPKPGWRRCPIPGGCPASTRCSRRKPHFADLIQKNPGDLRVRIALTNLRGSLGGLYALKSQMAEVDKHLLAAQQLWEPLAQQHPDNPEYWDWLATTCSWQAAGTNSQGMIARWLRLKLRAYALYQELAEEQPGNLEHQRKVALGRIRVAEAECP